MYEDLKARPERIRHLLDSEKDGALISSSLRTINEIKQGLQQEGMQSRLGLITGAVSTEERRDATKSFPLVLATPTVDIGYNFEKLGKSRQNIDFICFDALYGSEFTQRIGRAGRLLGKIDTNHVSIGHAFVQGKLYSQLQAGKVMIVGSLPHSLKIRSVRITDFITIFSPMLSLKHSIRSLPFSGGQQRNVRIVFVRFSRRFDRSSRRRVMLHLTN